MGGFKIHSPFIRLDLFGVKGDEFGTMEAESNRDGSNLDGERERKSRRKGRGRGLTKHRR